eukprot:1229094-Rhodomonas_salina.1
MMIDTCVELSQRANASGSREREGAFTRVGSALCPFLGSKGARERQWSNLYHRREMKYLKPRRQYYL